MRARNYYHWIIGPTVIAIGIAIFVIIEPGGDEILPVAPVAQLIAAIAGFVFLFKMWSAIQDGETRPRPAMAIIGLLIPIFNLYWVWRAWASWPVQHNAYVARNAKKVQDVNPNPFRTMVVMGVYAAPVLGGAALRLLEARRTEEFGVLVAALAVIAALWALVLFFSVVNRVCSAVTELEKADVVAENAEEPA